MLYGDDNDHEDDDDDEDDATWWKFENFQLPREQSSVKSSDGVLNLGETLER